MQVGRQARLRAQITLHSSSSPFVAHEVNEGRRAARMRLLLFTRQRETLLAVLLRGLCLRSSMRRRERCLMPHIVRMRLSARILCALCARMRACVLIVAAGRTLCD